MAYVTHTVDITYGSYFEKDYKVVCDENDENSVIIGKVTRQLSLNFLPMSSVKIKITNTVRHDD